MEELQTYKEIADLISRIFYYGDFKPETRDEQLLEERLIKIGMWPTTDQEIIRRPSINHL